MPINSRTSMYARVAVQGGGLVLHLNIAVFNFQTMHKVRLTLSEPHCSNVVAVISTAQMSFRGVKRRGNPQNRNEDTVAVASDRTCFRNRYRTENLRYQFEQGQELLPQLRQIICLVKVGRDTHTRLNYILPLVIPRSKATRESTK